MESHVTPKQVARAIGVSEASLKRWCDKGLIHTMRTAGGHRRLALASVCAFIRDTGQRLVDPAALGLPVISGAGNFVIERAADQMVEALRDGDEDRLRHIAHDLYLSGRTLAEICDRAIATALHTLGANWEHGRIDIYQERRAVGLCSRLICDFLRLLPRPANDAPRAIGATLENDPYSLPCQMVELTLREAGWRAESLGPGNPASAVTNAIVELKPRLVWVSISTIGERARLLADATRLFRAASDAAAVLVLGGRALSDELRHETRCHAACMTLGDLVNYSATMYRPAPATQASAG